MSLSRITSATQAVNGGISAPVPPPRDRCRLIRCVLEVHRDATPCACEGVAMATSVILSFTALLSS